MNQKWRKTNLATNLIYFETNNDNWRRFVKVFSLYLNWTSLITCNVYSLYRRLPVARAALYKLIKSEERSWYTFPFGLSCLLWLYLLSRLDCPLPVG